MGGSSGLIDRPAAAPVAGGGLVGRLGVLEGPAG